MKKKVYSKENFHTTRSDGRYDRTLGFLYEQFRRKKPKLSSDCLKSADEFPEWRRSVRKKLRELIGISENLHAEFAMLKEEKRDGYRIYHYEMYPEEYLAVPFLLLVPEKVIQTGGKVPAVICNPGSGARLPSLAGEPDNGPNRYPLRNRQAWCYAKAGMIALAVENPATGLNSEPGIAYGEVQLRCLTLLLQLGRTYHGFITEQRLMLLDFLKQHPLVDPERLACSGLSLGCGGTLYTAVLSDDVKAVVYNDFVCRHVTRLLSTTEISTNPVMACSFIPGANEWFDIQPDLMAALAPRPLLLAEGGSWKNCIEKVVHAYRMLGKENNLSVKYYPKFSDPASRKFEDIDLLTCEGLTPQEFLERSNVDASQHSFHPELAIPWLTRLFLGTEYNDSPLLAEIRRAKEEKERFFNADDEEIFPGRKS